MPTPRKTDKPEVLSPTFYDHYEDTGCNHAPRCLSCPFPSCLHDDLRGKQAAVKVLEDAERANAVVLLSESIPRHKAIKQVAKDCGVTATTVQRVMRRTGL